MTVQRSAGGSLAARGCVVGGCCQLVDHTARARRPRPVAPAPSTTLGRSTTTPTTSASSTVWLCRPGLAGDPCLSSTRPPPSCRRPANRRQDRPMPEARVRRSTVSTCTRRSAPADARSSNLKVDPEETAIAHHAGVALLARVPTSTHRCTGRRRSTAVQAATSATAKSNKVELRARVQGRARGLERLPRERQPRTRGCAARALAGCRRADPTAARPVDPNPSVRRLLVSAVHPRRQRDGEAGERRRGRLPAHPGVPVAVTRPDV